MTAAIVFAGLSALSNACSAILQRLAVVNRTSGARPLWRTAIELVRQPVWLLGVLFLAGTFGFQALALYFGPLSVVQPILVLELIFTLGLRVFLRHDDIAPRTWSAALIICLGLAAFLVVASPEQGADDAGGGQWILAVSVRGLAPLALLTGWPLYAMIATGILGTVLLQGAYAAGPLAASQATLLIVDPLASIALGIELFHENLSAGPGYVAGVVVSLAVLGTGVVLLSVWAPPVMTAGELAPLHHGPGRRPKELTDASPVV